MFFFLILIGFVLLNYFTNVFRYQNRDILSMYQPMKLLIFTGATGIGSFLRQIYLLIVIIPAGFCYFEDKKSNIDVYWISKTGMNTYYFGKTLAVFLTTFIMFTIPFLLEIILNCIAFPLKAEGDLDNHPYYDIAYVRQVHNYLFSEIYLLNIYIYTVFRIILLGIISGILAVFAMAMSTFNFFKFKILIIMPVFCLCYVMMYIGYAVMNTDETTKINYLNYLDFFNDFQKSEIGLVLFLIAVLGMAILRIGIKCKGAKKYI